MSRYSIGETWLRRKIKRYTPQEFEQRVDHQLVHAAVKDVLRELDELREEAERELPEHPAR